MKFNRFVWLGIAGCGFVSCGSPKTRDLRTRGNVAQYSDISEAELSKYLVFSSDQISEYLNKNKAQKHDDADREFLAFKLQDKIEKNENLSYEQSERLYELL